jgi:hypothetical protein
MPRDKAGQRKKAMLEALKVSLGIVTTACERAGVGRATHYRWLETDKEYATAVRQCEDIALDFAETSLMRQIGRGEAAATIFYLKTKGRNRGYVERKDVDVTSGGQTITPPILWTDAAAAE